MRTTAAATDRRTDRRTGRGTAPKTATKVRADAIVPFVQRLSREGLSRRTVHDYAIVVVRFLRGGTYDAGRAAEFILELPRLYQRIARAALTRYAAFLGAPVPEVRLRYRRDRARIPLTAGQIVDLKSAIERLPGETAAALTLLLNTGIRVGADGDIGLLRLRISDVVRAADGRPIALWVRRKGGEERDPQMVPLNDTAAGAVGRLVAARGPGARPDTPLVGAPGDSARTTYKALRAAFRSAIEGARLHQLRHTFATAALRDGVNVRELQELLGHVRLETTLIYTHVDAARLAEVVRKVQP